MFGQVYCFCLIPHLPLSLNIWNVFWSMGYSIFRYFASALVLKYVVLPCPSLLKHLKLKIWKCLWVGDCPDTFKAERIENMLFHNRIPLSYPKMHCVNAKSSVPAISPCLRSWFRGDRLAILIALLLALLSAPQRGERRRLGAARSTPSVRGRRFPTPVRAPVQVPRQLYDWIGWWYWQSFRCNQTNLIPHFGTMQPIWSRCNRAVQKVTIKWEMDVHCFIVFLTKWSEQVSNFSVGVVPHHLPSTQSTSKHMSHGGGWRYRWCLSNP